MWNVIIPAAASLIGGALQGSAAKEAAKIQSQGYDAATALQEKTYADQRQLAGPSYLTGGAATNMLASMYGLPAQDYAAAYNGGGGFGADDYGQSDQWSGYLSSNPDVYDYWKQNAKLREQFPNANEFAQYHYANFGQQEGRALPSVSSPSVPSSSNGLATAAGGGGFDMAQFWNSPYGQLATQGFRNIDTPEVRGAFAAGGKGLSGAQQKALDDRGRDRAGGAFGDYTNGLRSLAGLAQTGASQLASAGSNYAQNAGNLAMGAANARASGYSGQMNGLANGLSGAINTAIENWPKKKAGSNVDPSLAAYGWG